MNLQPAYGRDYKSKAEIISALKAEKDFLLIDMYSQWDGKPINLPQIEPYDFPLMIRYGQMRKVVKITQKDLA